MVGIFDSQFTPTSHNVHTCIMFLDFDDDDVAVEIESLSDGQYLKYVYIKNYLKYIEVFLVFVF